MRKLLISLEVSLFPPQETHWNMFCTTEIIFIVCNGHHIEPSVQNEKIYASAVLAKRVNLNKLMRIIAAIKIFLIEYFFIVGTVFIWRVSSMADVGK